MTTNRKSHGRERGAAKELKKLVAAGDAAAIARAQVPELFIRAFHGCDPKFLDLLLKHIKQGVGTAVPQIDAILQAAIMQASNAIRKGGFQDVPIREAIDFVHMYLHLTIKAHKFRFGPAVCGGPIEIGFITADRSFRWVRHKPFDSAIFQEEVGDYGAV